MLPKSNQFARLIRPCTVGNEFTTNVIRRELVAHGKSARNRSN